MNKLIKLAVSFLAMLGLNACGLPGGAIPSDHYYRLPAVEVGSATMQPETIVIKPVRVDGLYHERAMLYVDEHEPLELKRYHYHYWSETPASLVHKYLMAHFMKTGFVSDASGLQSAKIEMRPDLLNFERLVSNGKAEAYVRLHMHVQSSNKSEMLFVKTYEARVEAVSMTMQDTVGAFGQALDDIANNLTRDVLNARAHD